MLKLDFAHGLQPRARVGAAMLLASTCACAAVLLLWSRESASLDSVQLERASAAVAVAPPDARRRGAVAVRERPPSIDARWDDVLGALESHSGPDATLLAMEPVAKTGEVQLAGEARSVEAMLDYLAALQHDKRLKDVTLLTHQVQPEAPGAPIRFRMQAHWGDRS